MPPIPSMTSKEAFDRLRFSFRAYESLDDMPGKLPDYFYKEDDASLRKALKYMIDRVPREPGERKPTESEINASVVNGQLKGGLVSGNLRYLGGGDTGGYAKFSKLLREHPEILENEDFKAFLAKTKEVALEQEKLPGSELSARDWAHNRLTNALDDISFTLEVKKSTTVTPGMMHKAFAESGMEDIQRSLDFVKRKSEKRTGMSDIKLPDDGVRFACSDVAADAAPNPGNATKDKPISTSKVVG